MQPYLLKDIINRLSTCSATDVFIVLRWPVGLYLLSYVVQSVGFLLHGYFVEARMVPNLRRKIAVDATNLLLGKSIDFIRISFLGRLQIVSMTLDVLIVILLKCFLIVCSVMRLLLALPYFSCGA